MMPECRLCQHYKRVEAWTSPDTHHITQTMPIWYLCDIGQSPICCYAFSPAGLYPQPTPQKCSTSVLEPQNSADSGAA